MSTDEDQYTLHTGDGAVAGGMLDELADLYDVVHAGPVQEQGTLYHRESFLSRTRSQIERPGFSIVWARASEELIGFSFGLTLAAGRWWGGTSAEPPPTEILDTDKFAVIELMVLPDWRGRGIGRRLLDELLVDPPGALRDAHHETGEPGARDVRPVGLEAGWHRPTRPGRTHDGPARTRPGSLAATGWATFSAGFRDSYSL